MKQGIHPKYELTTITCACGAVYTVRSTRSKQRLEICAACHPFFTGKQKLVDTAGRVEKFKRRYAKFAAAAPKADAPAPDVPAPDAPTPDAPATDAPAPDAPATEAPTA